MLSRLIDLGHARVYTIPNSSFMQTHLEYALQASRLAETELRERERRLQISLDAAKVGYWDWDIQTGEVRWSDNLEQIHGQEPGSFQGTFDSFLEGVHPDDRQRVLDMVRQALHGGGIYEIEYRTLTAEGGIKWLEARGHVIRDDSGEPKWMSGLCMDATERHCFQEQLRRTQRLESLGLLAGGIAHDFNNLLATILGNASLALNAVPALSRAAPMLRDVISASERAAQLTRRLLAYAGKDQPTTTPTDLTEFVREMAPLLRTSIPKLVNLSLDLEEDLPLVRADQAQLQQVLMNLVINGAEAIPERTPGEVAVTIRSRPLLPDDLRTAIIPIEFPAPEYVELNVCDNGSGMDSSTAARIFDPFFTTKFTGRGLGLSAVLGIIGGHGGTIKVQSSPGLGTCFTVFLPAAPSAERHDRAGVAARIDRGSGIILVVDDEPDICEMVRRALEDNGYDVLLAFDGVEAVRRVSEHAGIRAAVLDFAMPAMGGDAAASLIREVRPDLPILFSSGYAQHDAEPACLEGGRSAFLQKPYDVARLLDALGRLLDN